VVGEQVKEGLVGLRVLPLELQSASASTIVREAGPALALDPVGQGAACLPELLGIVAAAGRFVIYVEETYVDQLKALRRSREDYSDVILRLAEPEGTRATVVKLVERG
jgi:hypothetical protein